MIDRYSFLPGLTLAVSGEGLARRHFEREYGEAAVADGSIAEAGPAALVASFGGRDRGAGPGEGATTISGGHKTMRWRISISEPAAAPIELHVAVGGWPRGYALSMIQGYFLEPLLSVAAARAGAVLLPAASFVVGGKATVVVGLSGSGKTSLSMQALAERQALLGDDQVLLTPDCTCRPFPRRLRLYPDLRDRVPQAYSELPSSARARLAVRRLVRAATGGWLAPSMALTRAAMGQAGLPEPVSVGRIVLLVRAPEEGDLRVEAATTGEAIEFGLAAFREQWRHLAACSEDWRRVLHDLERTEAKLLGRAFACAPVSRVIVPTPLRGSGMTRLAALAGIPGGAVAREVPT
jgi:hypothetical protein